jgi:superoxide dismutase, Cu-Zn family
MRRQAKLVVGLACAGALLMGCERKADNAPAEPSEDLQRGVAKAGEAIERGVEKAGEAIQHGVDKAAPVLEEGAKNVGAAIERGVEKAGPALEQGAKDVGKAIERGVDKTGAAFAPGASPGEPGAEASFESARGIELGGTAKFYEKGGAVVVIVNIDDATPGPHGIHIHEKGDCSDITGKSMGAHFDPKKTKHGLPIARVKHLGDLGNIDVDKDGKGTLEIAVHDASLTGHGASTFVGKAIVIHAAEDTGKGSSGNSGTPIACGVIKST